MDQHDKKNFRREGRSERRPGENRPQHGERRYEKRDGKPFEKREGKPFEKREGKPFEKRDGKPFVKREGKPFEKREGGKRPFDKRGPRPAQKPQAKPAPYQPSARDVALKALRNVARENAYAAQALDRELSVVHLSDDDRRLAASIFYFALENRLRIEKLQQ